MGGQRHRLTAEDGLQKPRRGLEDRNPKWQAGERNEDEEPRTNSEWKKTGKKQRRKDGNHWIQQSSHLGICAQHPLELCQHLPHLPSSPQPRNGRPPPSLLPPFQLGNGNGPTWPAQPSSSQLTAYNPSPCGYDRCWAFGPRFLGRRHYCILRWHVSGTEHAHWIEGFSEYIKLPLQVVENIICGRTTGYKDRYYL